MIEQARRALDEHLEKAIDDPGDLGRAQELVNSLCGAYIGEGEDEEGSASAEQRKMARLPTQGQIDSGHMSLDGFVAAARPPVDTSRGALAKIFREFPAPRRV